MIFNQEEKNMILSNEEVFPELVRIIKAQNKFKFDNKVIA